MVLTSPTARAPEAADGSAPAARRSLGGEIATPGLRVGLFGGSFNPPHEGHAHVARVARRALGLDRVWWLVSPQNPLKGRDETADLDDRLALTRALAPPPFNTVTDIERRLGVSATRDTLAALLTRHPATRFVWIMGADNLSGFHHWAGWRTIAGLAPMAIVARPGRFKALFSRAAHTLARHRLPAREARALADHPPPPWLYLPCPLHPASPTELRARGAAASKTKRLPSS